MSPEQSRRVDEIFEELADLPQAEQAYILERNCGSDVELKQAVLELLRADAAGHPLLDLNVSSIADRLLELPAQDVSIPGRVDNYLIRKLLGQGGMGAVYLAERKGLGDAVAIKVLRHAWNSLEERRRFASEQRVLASLNHRSIARLYDAGVFDDRQWFAMELVEGEHITEYCKKNRSTLSQRLHLLRAAAEAVSYAHRMLVVHRDLKPSNILVNTDGQAKLVDFGIAKHLSGDREKSGQTTMGSAWLSLNYSSPEQIRGEADSVLFDVYGLGVILYELLTGDPPADLTKASAIELARWLEQDVEPPSKAVRRKQKAGAPVPSFTATPSEWRELDLLCLTACAKQTASRYRSAEDLIRDLDHFLNKKPLDVHPKSLQYRCLKFCSRNRRAVLAAGITVLTFAAIISTFSWRLLLERDRALTSQARTERIHQLMLNLFEGDDEAAGPSESLRVVTLLDRGALAADHLRGESSLQADLQSTLGDLYHKLGRLNQSEPLLRRVYQQRLAQLGPLHPDSIRSEIALSLLLLDRSEKDEAAQLANDALSRVKRQPSRDTALLADALVAQGKVASGKGEYEAAIPLFEQAVKIYSAGPPNADLSEALTALANTEYYLGRLEVADALNQRLLDMDRKMFGEAHPNVGIDLYNLGNIALDRAQYARAEHLFGEGLQINRAWYGLQHPRTASTLLMLGQAVDHLGRPMEAADLYRQALEIYTKVYGQEHERVGQVLNYQGALAMRLGQLSEAQAYFSRAAEVFKKSNNGRDFYAHQLSNLAEVYRRKGNSGRAEGLLQEALGRLESTVPDSRYTGIAQTRMADVLIGEKRYSEAEQHALAGYRILEKLGPGASELEDARQALAAVYTALQQPEKLKAFAAR